MSRISLRPALVRRPLPLLALALAACAPGGAATSPTPAERYDLIIENGRIVDGTGAAWFYGDVAIRGDRIAPMLHMLDTLPATFGRRGQRELVRARLLVAAGDHPGAIEQLRQAVRAGVAPAFQLHLDPALLPLQSDPAFQALLRPVP